MVSQWKICLSVSGYGLPYNIYNLTQAMIKRNGVGISINRLLSNFQFSIRMGFPKFN